MPTIGGSVSKIRRRYGVRPGKWSYSTRQEKKGYGSIGCDDEIPLMGPCKRAKGTTR
jgi:hypothetical protein